jgi:putative aldouronate transport system substrate-binding protein
MFKRLLAVLMVLILFLSVFAGCSSNQQTSKEETTVKQEETAKAEESTAEPKQVELKQIDISLGWSTPDLNADEMGKFIQDKFKMKIQVVNMDGDKLKMAVASGDLPDVFGSEVGNNLFNQMKTDELIREIPQATLDKYTNLKKMVELNDVTAAFKNLTGKLYSIPRPTNADKATKAMSSAIYYRADWAKKLGINPPTTADELYAMLKAFKENDPDGNGKPDTFGTSGWLWQIHYIPWTDLYNWVKEDGRWLPGYVSKNMVPALNFWNKLYQEKILDPEFTVAPANDLFYTGKIGMLLGNAGDYWLTTHIKTRFQGANSGINAMEAVQLLPPIKMDDTSKPAWPANIESGCTVFSSECDDEKIDRILMFMDWILTPEGRDFVNYGWLDKDYMVKDGKAVSILPNRDSEYNKQKAIWEVYPSTNLFNLLAWKTPPTTQPFNPPIPADITALDEKFQNETYGPAVVSVNIFVNNVSTPAKDKFNVGLGDIEGELAKIISGKNPEADFEKYKKKLLEINGLQTVIDEVNKAVADQGLDK